MKGLELQEYICKTSQSSTCFIAFSGGKDSVAAYLYLQQCGMFKKIIPVFMYLIPDLEIIDRSMSYFEKEFKTRIIKIPHPSLWRMLRNMVFMPPELCSIVENTNLPKYTYEEAFQKVKMSMRLPECYIADGVRSADSPYRRIALTKYGPVNEKTKFFHVIHDWKKADVVKIIADNNIKMPEEFEIFKRSFDGVDYRFLKPLKDKFLEDYKKILEFFPLAELEIFRKEQLCKQSQ